MSKFNEKVRKANSKLIRRKHSKGRKHSRDEKGNKDRSNSHNTSSLSRIKGRYKKHFTQSHMTAEKDVESDEESKYNPKKRQIGMDFLEFVKKKPNSSNTKIFTTTQKTGSDWTQAHKLDKSSKKTRPNSAQVVETKENRLRSFEDVLSINEDLQSKVIPINEQPEESNTNRVSEELFVMEKSQEPINISTHNGNQNKVSNVLYNEDDEEVNARFMNSLYYEEKKLSRKSGMSKDYFETNKKSIKSHRKIRSKSRKDKPIEERKGGKSNSIDSTSNMKESKNLKGHHAFTNRPFSGDYKNQYKGKKPSIKITKPKQRPRTAKNTNKKIESDNKSPKIKRFVSPKSSNKSTSRRPKAHQQINSKDVNKKATNKKKKRKLSMSPNSLQSDNIQESKQPKISNLNPSNGNRRSMNDLESNCS